MTGWPYGTLDDEDFENYHKRVLYHLLVAVGPVDTKELTDAYRTLAGLLYLGTASTPLIDDNIHEYLTRLERDGKVARDTDTRPHTWKVLGDDHGQEATGDQEAGRS